MNYQTPPAGGLRPIASFTKIRYPDSLMGKEYRHDGRRTVSHTDGNAMFGWFDVMHVGTMQQLSDTLDSFDLSDIMVAGVPGAPKGCIYAGRLPSFVDPTVTYAIERRKENFEEPERALLVLDSDFDTAPDWVQFIQTPQDMYQFLTAVIPELAGFGMLVRPSGSNGVTNPDGSPYKSTRNFHVYITCAGAERVALIERLYALFAERGYGWIMVGSSGAMLPRGPVDRALRTVNQPVFAARPRVVPPVITNRPDPLVIEGAALALASLPEAADPQPIYDELESDEGVLARQRILKVAYAKTRARKALALVPKPTRAQARSTLEREYAQIEKAHRAHEYGEALPHDFVISTIAYGEVTVGELLADPDRYHTAKTHDPIEPDYRGWAQTGILYLKGNRVPLLVSMAHGLSTKYALRPELPFDLSNILDPQPIGERDALNTLPETVDLNEGQKMLSDALESFYRNPRNMAANVTPGGGKTTTAMIWQAHFENTHEVDARYTLYLAPMIKNCVEAYESYVRFGGKDGLVFLGREQPNPEKPDEQMCTHPEHVKRRLAFGAGDMSLCHDCTIRHQGLCGYDRQVQKVEAEQPSIIFASHAFAHYPIPRNWEPCRVIVDESLADGGISWEVKTPAADIGMLQHHPEGAKNALYAHMKTLADPLDINSIKEHRYRTLVLEGIMNGEKVFWMHGYAVLAERKRYRWHDVPTLVLDGTLRRKLAEMSTVPFDDVVNIDIYRHLRNVQVVGEMFSDSKMKSSKSMGATFLDIAEEYPAVFTTKKIRAALGKMDDPKWGHNGGVKGLNTWELAESALVLMYGQPNMAALVTMAEVLSGRDIGPAPEGYMETRYIMLRDGSVYPTEVHSHPDELVRELLYTHREDQILQLVDRVRAARAAAGEKYMLFCCPVALPIPVDVVVGFDEIWPDRYNRTLWQALNSGSGVVPASPRRAPAHRPDLWASVGAARNHYKKWGKNWSEGLEKVVIKPKERRVAAVYGYRLPPTGGQIAKSFTKTAPYAL